ncbi:VCBS repeat-containing protein [bacterium]|nr:VCBS repeat-containing protein [bacterium]
MGLFSRRDRSKPSTSKSSPKVTRFQGGIEALEDRLVMDYTVSFAADTLSIVASNGSNSDLGLTYTGGVFTLTELGGSAGIFTGSSLPTGVTIGPTSQLQIADSFFSGPTRRVEVSLGDGQDQVQNQGITGTRDRVFIDMGSTSDPSQLTGTTGNDSYDILGANSLITSGITFTNLTIVNAGGGADAVRGLVAANDAFTLIGPNEGQSEGIRFQQIESFDARSGPANLILDSGLVGTTTLAFSAVTNAVTARGISFTQIAQIDVNNRAITQTGLTRVQLQVVPVSGGGSQPRPIGSDILLRNLTSLNIDSIFGTAGDDAVLLTGDNLMSIGGVNYTGVVQFDGTTGNDRVDLSTGPASRNITFTSGDINNRINNLANVNFFNVDRLRPINIDVSTRRTVNLVNPTTASTTGNAGEVLVNGIVYENVVNVQNSPSVVGSAGSDALVVTANNQLLLNQVNFTGVTSYSAGAGNDSVVYDFVTPPTYSFDFAAANGVNGQYSAFGIDYTSVEQINTLGNPVTITNAASLGRQGNRAYSANGISFSNVNSATATSLFGTAGDDQFFLNTNGTVAFSATPVGDTIITLLGNRAVLGEGGNDQVFGPASTANDRYQFLSTSAAFRTPGGFLVGRIETLTSATASDTLFGTNGVDTFIFAGTNALQVGAASGFPPVIPTTRLVSFAEINGGDGDDSFSFTNDGSWTGNLVGGNGSDAIRGTDNDTTYTITGLTGSQITRLVGVVGSQVPQLAGTFAQFESVQGGAGVDTFLYQGGAFSSIALNGAGQPTAANAITNTDRGDVLDLSSLSTGVNLSLDVGSQPGGDARVVQVGTSDFFGIRNFETYIGTNQADRFVRSQQATGVVQVMDGRGGADLFQIGNGSPDIVIYDALDQISSIDATLDTLIASPSAPGTPPPTPGVFSPTPNPVGGFNLWLLLQSTQPGGFITANNFPLIAEAYVRYLYRLLLGGDPNTTDGQRIVSFWTQRLTNQSLSSFDLVGSFLTQNVADIGGTNPPAPQYFADYFFNGFAQREYGRPFAGQDTTRLANLVKGGATLESAARTGNFRAESPALAQAWIREILYNILSPQENQALRADASRAFLVGAPTRTTYELFVATTLRFLVQEQRSWLGTLQRVVNSLDGLRSSIRVAAAENPGRFAGLMADANLTNLKLGSLEASGVFIDNPPGRGRELSPNGISFGVSTDTPTPGDWTGDGREEFGVFRQGTWFLDTNGTNGFQAADTSVAFGVGSDIPMPGNWNGGNQTNLGVFRNGTWFLDTNRTLGWQSTDTAIQFGVAGDTPIVGDWNGDGVSDLGVRRGNVWFLDTNGIRGWQGNDTTFADTFGPGQILSADFNADGRDDIAVINGNTWRIDFDGPFGYQPGTDVELQFDANGGKPFTLTSGSPTLVRQFGAGAGSLSAAVRLLGPLVLPTSNVSTNAFAGPTTNSNGGSNTTGNLADSNGPAGQPTLLGRSRPTFGSAGVSATASVEGSSRDRIDALLLAKAKSDVIDQVFEDI